MVLNSNEGRSQWPGSEGGWEWASLYTTIYIFTPIKSL